MGIKWHADHRHALMRRFWHTKREIDFDIIGMMKAMISSSASELESSLDEDN